MLRHLLPALLGLLPCLSLAALPSPVQTANSQTISGLNVSATFGSGVTGGHLVIAVIATVRNTQPSPFTSVTDDKGDTFTLVNQGNTTGGSLKDDGVLAYCLSATAGASTVTATDALAPAAASILIAEYPVSGASLDQSTGTTGVSASAASGSITTANATDLLIGWCVTGNSTTLSNPSPSGDFTTAGTTLICGFSDALLSSSGAQSSSYTLSTSYNWICGVAAFTVPSATNHNQLLLTGVGIVER